MRWTRLPRSLGLALVAGVCLLAQLGGFVHLVLVRHETCLEHASMGHGETAAPARAAARTAPLRARLLGQPAAQHADDHCLLLALRKRDGLDGPLALAGALPDPRSTPTLSALTAHQGPPPVPLLRLAPKASPPASAA